MGVFRALVIIAFLTFLSAYSYNLDEKSGYDSCFSDEISITIFKPTDFSPIPDFLYAHGGGLNKCGCHFNRKTGECHCHRNKGCGCECQPSSCN